MATGMAASSARRSLRVVVATIAMSPLLAMSPPLTLAMSSPVTLTMSSPLMLALSPPLTLSTSSPVTLSTSSPAAVARSSSAGSASGNPPKASADAVYKLKAAPLASFVWFPTFPRTGERVSLVSTSTDYASPIVAYAWNLAESGAFGAFQTGGPTISTTFTTPANHTVQLRVTNTDDLSSIAAETIHMSTPPPSVMLPFPIVRIVGTDRRFGVTIRLLAVEAPVGARITIRCRHRGCPAKSSRRVATSSKQGKAVWVRFRRFEHFLRAGIMLEVRVSKDGQIGAYTRFIVRRHRLPVRVDTCLDPAGIKPIVCPSS